MTIISRDKAATAAHKMHFTFHAAYLSAAVMEGHLWYSLAAGALLLVTLAGAMLGAPE